MSQSTAKIIDYKLDNKKTSELVLTPNQLKIISEKFQKNDKSPEAWLLRVARNISLAELLYHPLSYRWGLFDGVRVNPKESLLLFHKGLHSSKDREENFQRFMENCEAVTSTHAEAADLVSEWTNHFYNLLASWTFLPNSPTLMNAGRDLQQLAACYVIPVEDSMEGITGALQAQALIHKSGGGTGFSFDALRPAGDPVKSTSGVASGAISFMKLFDRMTDVVKQGGNRRGANMGIISYHHPEISDFIALKGRPGVMENFNLSVTVDDAFFDAVSNDDSVQQRNPKTNQITGSLSAKKLFHAMAENAWASGDPGVVFIDKINNSTSNPTPELGQILATNPCGEQPLLPNEPCNLGSLNLSVFVKGPTLMGKIDWDELKNAVTLAIRFLDDTIDVNNYPLPEIEFMAKGNRRIGLGVMGWAEMLVRMGIPYDSEKALELAKDLMKFINDTALAASEDLAKERGAFPNWKDSIYDPKGPHFRGRELHPRHCARTTIAPTGTIALVAGLQGAGIEPFYAIAYTRYTAKALDHIKRGIKPSMVDFFVEINPYFLEVARQYDFFGLAEAELLAKIESNNKSIRGLKEIPENIQTLFATSHDISVDWHVKMQAAFQTHTDNAVSKTINLPNHATVDDVKKAFFMAHDLDCKGITIYRDGSRQQQVLNLAPNDKKAQKARELSVGVSSESFDIKTIHGTLNVYFDFDENGPCRMVVQLDPIRSEMGHVATLIGNVVTKFLEKDGDPNEILRTMLPASSIKKTDWNNVPTLSIVEAIGTALKRHLEKHQWLDLTKAIDGNPLELWSLATAKTEKCPQCQSQNVGMNSGCSGILCYDCGYSVCQ